LRQERAGGVQQKMTNGVKIEVFNWFLIFFGGSKKKNVWVGSFLLPGTTSKNKQIEKEKLIPRVRFSLPYGPHPIPKLPILR
jgi:hypothetical protein